MTLPNNAELARALAILAGAFNGCQSPETSGQNINSGGVLPSAASTTTSQSSVTPASSSSVLNL